MTTRTGPGRPDASEHDAYYVRYIDLVPDGDIFATLEGEMEETQALLATVTAVREEFRYLPGRWSVREVVGHLIDAERVFAFRCLWMARGAEGALPSMNQDAWAEMSNAGSRPLSELAEEWAQLRRDNLVLFRSMDDAVWDRVGMASGRSFTVRSFPWIIAGHELYHRALLKRDYHMGVDA